MAVRRVVPAILTDKPDTLKNMVRQAEKFTSWVQFDIMDGLFVPPQSIYASDIAAVKPDFKWDAHLMVNHPESHIQGFWLAGARRITLHYEAASHPADWATYIKAQGMEAGLALNPETETQAVSPEIARKFDIVLLLSVNPGYYGRPFIPEVLTKATELKCEYPGLLIGMDGGIKASNIINVARTGVDEICVGSAIFGAQNPEAAYQNLIALAEKGWQEYCERCSQ